MKLFKRTALSSLAILLVLSTTACDKASDKAEDKASDKATATETSNTSENVLADMMVDTLALSLKGVKNSVTDITDEQKACIDKIDVNSQKKLIQEEMEKAFDKKELKELNDFYSKPEIQAVVAYGEEKMMASVGMNVEEKTEKPTEETIKLVADFSQSEVGQKFDQFSISGGGDELGEKIATFFTKELEKCGLSDEK